MDDSKPNFVSLTPSAQAAPAAAPTEPAAPPAPKKRPAETRSSEEEAAERIVKTSKYKS